MLKTDPASKLLVVEDTVLEMPANCLYCQCELQEMAQLCQGCKNFALFPKCYSNRSRRARRAHDNCKGAHTFKGVDLNR